MTTYTLKACEDFINNWIERGGEVVEVREGVLGLGTMLLCGIEGKKSVVINERYVSDWNSTHSVRFYNKLPAKYQKIFDNL